MISNELFIGPLPEEVYKQVTDEFHLFRQDRTVEVMARALYGQKMARLALDGSQTELAVAKQRLENRNIDTKSGVLTHDAWKEEVEMHLSTFKLGRRRNDTNNGAVLIQFDAEKFKRINDELGQSAGDRTIGLIGAYLIEHARPDDLIGRLGGDEFGWFAPFNTEETSALAVLESIEARLLDFAPDRYPGMPGLRWNHAFYCGEDMVEPLLEIAEVKGDAKERTRSHAKTPEENQKALTLALSYS